MLADGVRTFLAIGIPEDQQLRLAEVQEALGRHAKQMKWVRPKLLHLTVRFLGNVDRNRLELVTRAAAQATADLAPFTLRLTDIGAFPSERSPRVIWVGLLEDSGLAALQRLFALTENALAASGFERESRAYAPHLTLGRVRDDVSQADRREVGESLRNVRSLAHASGVVPVTELLVMRSDLSRSGPTYTVISRTPLGHHVSCQ
jgi:2'-5' RNA ligase